MNQVKYSEIDKSNLIIDCTYQDSRAPGSPINQQPLLKIFPGLGNMKGIRVVGNVPNWKLYVLTSTESESDWPDYLDPTSGVLTYWGDNRTPGKEIHQQPGNRFFREIFGWANLSQSERERIPPGFYFTHGDYGRDMVFRGLIIPKTNQVGNTDDLISVWRSKDKQRFQNYRAKFSVLDSTEIDLNWIRSVLAGRENMELAPKAWTEWKTRGIIRPLEALKTLEYRKKAAQLPSDSGEQAMLIYIHKYFEPDDHLFEYFAAAIWKMSDSRVFSGRVTRRNRDGGRDAVGEYKIGPDSEPISLDWALEAKRYAPGEVSVGVSELSRLISRIRIRQFGVLVTTSFVSDQAYKEIREDQHPIIVIAGTDIIAILKQAGIADLSILKDWLIQNFPINSQSDDLLIDFQRGKSIKLKKSPLSNSR